MQFKHYLYKGEGSVPQPSSSMLEASARNENDVVFFSAAVCPFAQRVNLCLHFYLKAVLANLTHYEFPLHMKRPDWFRELNPNDKVPVLIHKGKTLFESSVIVEYLNDFFGEKLQIKFVNGDLYRRALWRALRHHFNENFINSMYSLWLAQDDAEREKQREKLHKSYAYIDAFLKKHKRGDGPFFEGTHFGALEVTVAPFYQRLRAMLYYRDAEIPAACDTLAAHFKACTEHEYVLGTSVLPHSTDSDEINRALIIYYVDYALGVANGRGVPAGREYSSFNIVDFPLATRNMPEHLKLSK